MVGSLHGMPVCGRHYITFNGITWHFMSLYDKALHRITRHYMALHYITSHCITLQVTTPPINNPNHHACDITTPINNPLITRCYTPQVSSPTLVKVEVETTLNTPPSTDPILTSTHPHIRTLHIPPPQHTPQVSSPTLVKVEARGAAAAAARYDCLRIEQPAQVRSSKASCRAVQGQHVREPVMSSPPPAAASCRCRDY